MNCCPNCFNDAFLISVIKQKSNHKATCNFCNTEDIYVIDSKRLNDYFQPLLDLYEPSDDNGKPIVHLLKKDWVLFTSLNDENTIELLESIFDLSFQ